MPFFFRPARTPGVLGGGVKKYIFNKYSFHNKFGAMPFAQRSRGRRRRAIFWRDVA